VKKHYIAMAGLHGYLPQYYASHDTYEEAMEDLISLHEIEDRELKEELKETGFVYLDIQYHGNEYAEIIECDCSINLDIHRKEG